jgi:hypothetical protein
VLAAAIEKVVLAPEAKPQAKMERRRRGKTGKLGRSRKRQISEPGKLKN